MDLATASLTDIQRAYAHSAFVAKLAIGDAETCLWLAQRDILARERQARMIRVARRWTGDASIGTATITPMERRIKALTGRPAWLQSATG